MSRRETAAAATVAQPTVQIIDLTRRFGDFTAVDRANLDVRTGEAFAFIGPNGAGKSTLIKMLTTLLPPTSGDARIAGFDLIEEPHEVRRSIGYVPQLVSADGSLTGFENLLLSARLYAIPHREQKERIHAALERMGLTGAADRLVEHYSGGMIRRLEIAQSTLHEPAVLFMDEPTLGLDPSAREGVWRHVRALQSSIHVTLVLTSHYMQEIEELCDRIALMSRGRIVAVGSPAELKAKVGPGASLDDVFALLVQEGNEPEIVAEFGELRRSRRPSG